MGTFLTVVTSMAEVEAHIATASSWFWRRAIKIQIDIHTLPETNPLHRCTNQIKKFRRFHCLLLYQIADALKNIKIETLETINPFILVLQEEQIQTVINKTLETHIEIGRSIQIIISSSVWNKVVGFSRVVQSILPQYKKPRLKTFSVILGIRLEQNLYLGELVAIAHALSILPVLKQYRITLLTNNKATALTLQNP